MKRVILLRHAKAVLRGDGLPDFNRSLVEKGRIAAEKIAIRTKKKGFIPALIVSSTANRAIETARIFAEVFNQNPNGIVQKDELYEHLDEKTFFRLTGSIKPEIESVMLVGHDPAMSDLAKLLAKSFSESLPTSGIVALDFDAGSWADVRKKEGELAYFDYPKKNRESYAALSGEIAKGTFDAIFSVLHKANASAAESFKEKAGQFSERITKAFIKEVKTMDKKR